MFVRVRPPDPNLEGDVDHAHCVEVTSMTSLSMQSRPEPKVFTFDHVAGMQTTQVYTCTCNMHSEKAQKDLNPRHNIF